MWVIGGHDESGASLNDVWSSTDGITWTLVTQFLLRSQFQVLVHDGKMWILGGLQFNEFKNDVWSSTDGITWTQETASAGWSGRYLHQAQEFGGTMWVLGGSDGSLLNDVWSTIAP